MRKTLLDALIEAAEHGSSFTLEYVRCPTCGQRRNVVEIVGALPEDGVEADWLCGNDIQDRLRRSASDAMAVTMQSAEARWPDLRGERDRRLAQSDREVLPDRWERMDDATKEAWATYRDALRDLPEVTDDPFNPVWPTPPT